MKSANILFIQRRQSRPATFKAFIGLAGVALIGLMTTTRDLWVQELIMDPRVSLSLAVAALLFGVSALMAWRSASEDEALMVVNGEVRLLQPGSAVPVFQAPLEGTRLYKLVPPGGDPKIFLRDQVRAVEVFPQATSSTKESLFKQIEAFLHSQGAHPQS